MIVEVNNYFLDFDHYQVSSNSVLLGLLGVFRCTQRIFFAEFCMLSLNLVFVPFCEFLVDERTTNLTSIKGNGFYN